MAATQDTLRSPQAFPLAEHDERAWGSRLHLPLQLVLGMPGTAHRGRCV